MFLNPHLNCFNFENFLKLISERVNVKCYFIKAKLENEQLENITKIKNENLITEQFNLSSILISNQFYKKNKFESNEIILYPKMKILIKIIEKFYQTKKIAIFHYSIKILNFLKFFLKFYFPNIKIFNFNSENCSSTLKRNEKIKKFKK
jgi:hypothetical protein